MIDSLVRNRFDKLFGPSLFEEKDVDPYVVAEVVWDAANRNLLQFFDQVDPARVFFVRYEDLVHDPARMMQDICRFLGIPFTDEVLKPYDGRRERMITGLGDPNILDHKHIDEKLGNAWQGIQLPRYLDASTREIATKLGYELPEQAPAPIADVEIEKQLLENLDQLSDAQVQALLAQMLAGEESK